MTRRDVLACVLALVLLVLLWYVVDVLLLVFAAILVALLLRTPAEWLTRRTGIAPGWTLAAVVLGAIILGGAAAWFFGYELMVQLGELFGRLPELVARLRAQLAGFDWVLGSLDPRELLEARGALARGIGLISATFGALASLVIVLVIAVFLAAQPGLYVGGLLQLVPARRRGQAGEVLGELGRTLRRWLVGQFFLMLLIGSITGAGLWLLGVEMALALAVLAGLLEFVPYAGPLLAAVPALLVALGESTTLALYVLLFYVGIQSVEGYLLQPLVQRRTVHLPPALTLLAQVVFGVLLGALGVILATPLAASLMILTRKLYIEEGRHS